MTDGVEGVNSKASTRIEQYLQVRNKLKVLDEEHEARRAPYVELQNMLSGWLEDFMKKTGSESIKTEHGTCYTKTRYTASLADPEAFMKFVVDNKLYDLLDRKANSPAVKEYVETNKALPPGCNLNAIKSVGVRTAS
jgi:hypothetical protein